MKRVILTKGALFALMFYVYEFVKTEYSAQEAWMVIPFLFGIYMIVIPLFMRNDVKFKDVRIAFGAAMTALTIIYSHPLQEFFKYIGLVLLGILSIAVIYSPIIALAAYLYWSIRY